jgi:hypothetical protein
MYTPHTKMEVLHTQQREQLHTMIKFIKKLGFYLFLIILSILISTFINWRMATAEAPTLMPCTDYFDIRDFAKCEIEKKWGLAEWDSFNYIINSESNWNYKAKNPNSSATGLPQAMLSIHDVPDDYLTNPQTQILWGIQYIESTYKSPSNAWKFHLAHNWY